MHSLTYATSKLGLGSRGGRRTDEWGDRPHTRQALSKAHAFSVGVKEEVSHKFSPNLKRNALMVLRNTPECLLFYSINCSPRLNLIYVRKTPISARAFLLDRVQSVTHGSGSFRPFSRSHLSRFAPFPVRPGSFRAYSRSSLFVSLLFLITPG